MTGINESKMISRFSSFLGLVLYAMSATPVAAHSPQGAMNDVQQREPYLQPVNTLAPDFNLEDAWGRQHALGDYRGKVVILNFIYTRCKEACPLHNVLLAKIQKQIQAADMQGQVQFVTIATDTEDAASTVAIMRNYGKTYGLDPENWVLLSGAANNAPDAGIKVAKDYGLDFVVVSDEVQMHGVVTHIIDPQGMMRARFHGLKFNPDHLTAYVISLLHVDHSDSWTNTDSTLHQWWDSKTDQWVTGFLLITGFWLLVLGGIRLKRLKTRRASVAPNPVNALPDSNSTRPNP